MRGTQSILFRFYFPLLDMARQSFLPDSPAWGQGDALVQSQQGDVFACLRGKETGERWFGRQYTCFC